MRYFGIADMLYKTQHEWIATSDPPRPPTTCGKIGKGAGLTNEQIDACMKDADKAEALVALVPGERQGRQRRAARPRFVINGRAYSNMAYDDIAKILTRSCRRTADDGPARGR